MNKLIGLIAVIFAVAGCTTQPVMPPDDVEMVLAAAPTYPEAARERRVEGCTTVSFEVNAQGRADLAQILDSSPQGVFDGVTLTALSQSKFGAKTWPGRHARTYTYTLSGSNAHGQKVKERCKQPSYAELNPAR